MYIFFNLLPKTPTQPTLILFLKFFFISYYKFHCHVTAIKPCHPERITCFYGKTRTRAPHAIQTINYVRYIKIYVMSMKALYIILKQ